MSEYPHFLSSFCDCIITSACVLWANNKHHIFLCVRAAFEKEIEGLPTTRSVGDLPPELRCPLCKEVMKDAVLTSKCCFRSFCDKCKLSFKFLIVCFRLLLFILPSYDMTGPVVFLYILLYCRVFPFPFLIKI